MMIVHRTRFLATSLWYRLRALHHQCAAFRTDLSGWAGFRDVLALGIVGTGEERAESAAALHHLASCSIFFLTRGTCDTGFCALRFRRVLFNEFAFRVVGAGDEAAESSFALNELSILTLRARLADLFGRSYFTTVFLSCPEAFRKTLAAHEAARAGEFVDHSLLAQRAGEFGRRVAHVGQFFYLRFAFHCLGERRVKTCERFYVFALAFCYLIKLIFHFRGKGVADVLGKMFLKKT